MTSKVLLDTDIGSDIDDAVCLAYLLAQPKCELVGVTTVTGESQRRAMMVSALCQVAGKADVPIYPGAEVPLIIKQRQPTVPQADVLERWPHASDFPTGDAVEFLRQTIRANPGEITLLAIGPLTNVALLFAVDPEIPSLLKSLVLMCGVFNQGRDELEWNAMLDPEATAIVYRAKPPIHRSIGLDVTRQVTMPADEVRQRFDKKLLLPVRDFAEVWFKERPEITFHDPLAAVTLFDEQVCGFEAGLVEGEVTDRNRAGHTAWQPGHPDAQHQVATTVDADRFFQQFFSVFE